MNRSIAEVTCELPLCFVWQAKKMRARNETEATEAELQTAKMQVDAADAAEDSKKRIHDKSA